MEQFENNSQQQNTENMEKNLNSIIKENGGLIDMENTKHLDELTVGDLTLKQGEVLEFASFGAPGKKTEWRVFDIRQPENSNYAGHNYSEGYTEVILVNPDKNSGYTQEEVQIRTHDQLEAMKGNIKVKEVVE
jgi:hypothetical protein